MDVVKWWWWQSLFLKGYRKILGLLVVVPACLLLFKWKKTKPAIKSESASVAFTTTHDEPSSQLDQGVNDNGASCNDNVDDVQDNRNEAEVPVVLLQSTTHSACNDKHISVNQYVSDELCHTGSNQLAFENNKAKSSDDSNTPGQTCEKNQTSTSEILIKSDQILESDDFNQSSQTFDPYQDTPSKQTNEPDQSSKAHPFELIENAYPSEDEQTTASDDVVNEDHIFDVNQIASTKDSNKSDQTSKAVGQDLNEPEQNTDDISTTYEDSSKLQLISGVCQVNIIKDSNDLYQSSDAHEIKAKEELNEQYQPSGDAQTDAYEQTTDNNSTACEDSSNLQLTSDVSKVNITKDSNDLNQSSDAYEKKVKDGLNEQYEPSEDIQTDAYEQTSDDTSTACEGSSKLHLTSDVCQVNVTKDSNDLNQSSDAYETKDRDGLNEQYQPSGDVQTDAYEETTEDKSSDCEDSSKLQLASDVYQVENSNDLGQCTNAHEAKVREGSLEQHLPFGNIQTDAYEQIHEDNSTAACENSSQLHLTSDESSEAYETKVREEFIEQHQLSGDEEESKLDLSLSEVLVKLENNFKDNQFTPSKNSIQSDPTFNDEETATNEDTNNTNNTTSNDTKATFTDASIKTEQISEDDQIPVSKNQTKQLTSAEDIHTTASEGYDKQNEITASEKSDTLSRARESDENTARNIHDPNQDDNGNVSVADCTSLDGSHQDDQNVAANNVVKQKSRNKLAKLARKIRKSVKKRFKTDQSTSKHSPDALGAVTDSDQISPSRSSVDTFASRYTILHEDQAIVLSEHTDGNEEPIDDNNLIIEGMQEDGHDLKGKVSELFETIQRDVVIEKAYRMPRDADRPDCVPIVMVEFTNYEDKEQLMKRVRQMSESSDYVHTEDEDLSTEP